MKKKIVDVNKIRVQLIHGTRIYNNGDECKLWIEKGRKEKFKTSKDLVNGGRGRGREKSTH